MILLGGRHAGVEKLGVTILVSSPDELAQRQIADYSRWARVIKAANTRTE